MSTYQAADVLAASSSTTVITLSTFAMTGSNRNIAAFALHRAGTERQITSVVRGTDTYTEAGEFKQGNAKVEVHNSTNEPQTSTATLAITINSANGTWCAGYIASDEVNQTTRINGIVHNESGSAGSLSVNVTSATGDLVCSAIAVAGDIAGGRTLTATGTNHTKRAEDKDGANSIFGGTGSKPGETTATVGYSWTTSTLECVLFGWNHPDATSPPVNTAPASSVYIPTNSLSSTTLSDFGAISVASGASAITSVSFTCTSGKGTMTMTASGSAEVSGNGTNAVSVTADNDTDFNNTIDTLAFQGASGVREAVTITMLSSDGTLTDSDPIVVLNDPTNLTLVAASYADLIAAIQTVYMRLPTGETSDTVTLVATDDDTLTDTQIITLSAVPPSNDGDLLITASTGGLTDVIM